MKKIAILLIAAMCVSASYAQLAKVVTAYRYLKDFGETKDVESLNKAKEAIDIASENPDTKDETKTSVYKGQIYYTIFENNLRTLTEKLNNISDPNKKTLMGYQATKTTELEVAYDCFTKARTQDTKGKYKDDIDKGMSGVVTHFENKAIADYNAKKFADALPSFEKAYLIKGVKDTNTLSNCALVAELSGNYDKAKKYYTTMIDNKQGRGKSYLSLVNVYLMTKDTVTAMTTLKKGREAYPADINLLIKETDYFISSHKSEEALLNLNQAILAKPNDHLLYFARGNTFDMLANPKDLNGKDLPRPKDYDDKLKAAEADYKKSIELKPTYFDALFNLGVLYMNEGVAINRAADKISTDKAADKTKYETENAKSIDAFSKAMPVLEKALELNPKDRNTMVALKQIYARLQQTDKLNAMNEKLK